MKLKTEIKFLLAFAIISITMLLLETTKVQAFSGDDLNDTSAIFADIIQGTPTENSLKDIPSTISLDMKKTETDQIVKIIYNQVEDNLEKQGLKLKKENYTCNNYYISIQIVGDSNFNNLKKSVEKVHIGIYNTNTIVEKNITINWTNKSTYNETDKKYVENQLSKLPRAINAVYQTGDGVKRVYYMAEQEHELGTEDLNILSTFKNITGLSFISLTGTGGPLLPFNESNECIADVYKDGICYTQINILFTPPTKVTVPNNIEDTDIAYMNYAKPKIQEYINNYDFGNYKGNVTLEKISGYWYRVLSDGDNCGEIIIKKAEGAYIGNNIYVDNLPLNANITVTPTENNLLETEVKSKGYSKILGSYELKLIGINELQTAIDIIFNVGTENNGKTIYILHKKENGTYENFEKEVSNGKVIITVSELSPFVLGIKEDANNNSTTTQQPTQNNNTTTTKPKPTTNKGEKDNTPKTGTVDIINYVSIATLVSMVGIIVLKKKLK